MEDMGYTGVLLGGSTSSDVNADLNEVRNTKIHGWQTAGDWIGADGGKAYDATLAGASAWASVNNAVMADVVAQACARYERGMPLPIVPLDTPR